MLLLLLPFIMFLQRLLLTPPADVTVMLILMEWCPDCAEALFAGELLIRPASASVGEGSDCGDYRGEVG